MWRISISRGASLMARAVLAKRSDCFSGDCLGLFGEVLDLLVGAEADLDPVALVLALIMLKVWLPNIPIQRRR
jgi:hypothetical protein